MKTTTTDLVVVGAGPGGYAAAFYAADCGKSVVLVEKDAMGGVCLNRGCIPSKALLNMAHTIEDAKHAQSKGITFGDPKIDIDALRNWKDGVVSQLSNGIQTLANARKITVLKGRGIFEDSSTLRVEESDGQHIVKFEHAIIAVGSKPAIPRAFDLGNPRIMTSTDALNLPEIPKRLLIVGGGYIGMELGTVYTAFGSEITLVEALPNILTGADPDLVRPVMAFAKDNFNAVHLACKVMTMETSGKKIKVTMDAGDGPLDDLFDRVLVSVGRTPNVLDLGLKNTAVKQDDKGFIQVDHTQKTTDPNIYAIGDVAGGVLLAHKASKEARIAVDTIHGESATNKDLLIPAVVFTDPEVAWCGLTEIEAKANKITHKVARFPWAASGRAATLGQTKGLTKLILDPETERVLGVGIVGRGAGELIAEGVLAVEMEATAADLADVIHAHPTLSETVMESAEVFLGHCTHLS